MKYNILILLSFIVIMIPSCTNTTNHTTIDEMAFSTCHFDSLGSVLQDLGICLNVDAQTWEDTIHKDPKIKLEWRYFYDTTYFKAYKMSNKASCENLLLLEISINHGSGEYDNYIIKTGKQGYEIVTEFKGYLNDIIVTNEAYFKLTYQIYITNNKSCLVTGSFDGNQMVTDTVLSNDNIYKRIFIKDKPW